MIVTNPRDFLSAIDQQSWTINLGATAEAAYLVSPANFSLAAESATDNAYMDLAQQPDPLAALAEHAELARRIAEDVPVITFPGDPQAMDGVFPNNAFATVPGRLIVGRMRHAVRQRETRRADIRAWFTRVLGRQVVDLSDGDFVAELTGSLVIDRARGIGYCGLSDRCDMAGAHAMHEAFGLRLTYCFRLADGEYHTNVVMSVLAGRAVVLHAGSFADPRVPELIAARYAPNVVWLSDEEKANFAGNCIALAPDTVFMSARADAALSETHRQILRNAGFTVRSVDLTEIEQAGGSLRCCVAEIF